MKKNDLLLVIDMQNVYKKGQKWECLHTEEAALNVKKIIGAGMENAVFTRFIADPEGDGVWQNYLTQYSDVNFSQEANAMVSEFDDLDLGKRFPLYSKGTYSSLENPDVLEACRKADRVVVAGVVAECCVLSTVFALIDKGIYTVYLTDAVSGLDVPKEKATELTLSGLSPLHVSMMTTQEYIEEK